MEQALTTDPQSTYKLLNTELKLLADVTILHGVGKQLAEKLAKLGISTILDLLLHLPYKYQDRTRITNIADLRVNTHAVIQGQVVHYKINYNKSRSNKSGRSLLLYLQDSSGIIELRFFNFNNTQLEQFQDNPTLRCFGEIKYSYSKSHSYLSIIHPEYQLISKLTDLDENSISQVEDTLRAVYPSTDGISQRKWLDFINQALNYLDRIYNHDRSQRLDYLPESIIKKYNFIDFYTAIKIIHQPTPDISIELLVNRQHPAQQRLIFEELMANQLAMKLVKKQQKKYTAPSLNNKNYVTKLLELIPFDLTAAQLNVFNEISNDLSKNIPMSRLLQGDVGSGKTIVAALAILQAVGSGYQVALMAPTEILAEQLYNNLNNYFIPLELEIKLLVSKQFTKTVKEEIKQNLANNQLKVIIGTHALIQDSVSFSKLGLVIIDEQHRFGVEQRHTLWSKGIVNKNGQEQAPHQLTMTATPIPRTLAMTLYSNMDYSVIDELPPGRKPIQTLLLSERKRSDLINKIKNICDRSEQVYWVCTLIDDSEVLSAKAATESYNELCELLPRYTIGLIHGRLKPEEKAKVMKDFSNNKINILVATTVIEVGVNIPNASLMVIENPERLGIAQLHQLRGRVGRGNLESYCILLYKTPIGEAAKQKLTTIRNYSDGFKLAEYDLQFRGSGEILGKRQTGSWRLRIADLIRDKNKLKDVDASSEYIIKKHPEFILPYIKLWLGENYKLAMV